MVSVLLVDQYLPFTHRSSTYVALRALRRWGNILSDHHKALSTYQKQPASLADQDNRGRWGRRALGNITVGGDQ